LPYSSVIIHKPRKPSFDIVDWSHAFTLRKLPKD